VDAKLVSQWGNESSRMLKECWSEFSQEIGVQGDLFGSQTNVG